MNTLTPDQLAHLLRTWAAGCYTDEAAAQLLCEHRSWLTRADFLAACVKYDHDGTAPVAWIDWEAVPAFVERAACSSSEGRVLRLAAELAGVDTGVPLGDLLTSLDDDNSRLVLSAITHAHHTGDRPR
jgi:hypothetical protein